MKFPLTLAISLFFSVPVFATSPTYEISARYNTDTHKIEGSENLRFLNDGTTPLSELYFFLYPNLYRNKQRELGHGFYQKAYPVTFNSGDIEIMELRDEAGIPLIFFPQHYENTLIIKVQLKEPIPAGDEGSISLKFKTKIPQKWGVFGYYKQIVALQGGWYPYLVNFEKGEWLFRNPPQKGDYRVQLKLPQNFIVVGSVLAKSETIGGSEKQILFEASQIPFFSLFWGPELKTQKRQLGPFQFRYHGLDKNKHYAKQVVTAAEQALAFYLQQHGLYPNTHFEIVETGLYQDLSTAGSNVLFVNNRLFKVFPALKGFHKAAVARGLYRLLWRKKRPLEAEWMIDVLAKMDAEAFMQTNEGTIISLEEWLSPIAFIPVIDQILYSEDLPLRKIYFKGSIRPPLSEDIRTFNNPASENAAIFTNIQNLLGKQAVAELLQRYLAQADAEAKPFLDMLSEMGRHDLPALVEQWLTVRAKLDYQLVSVKKRKDKGQYETEIMIQKEGVGTEPLQFKVTTDDGEDHSFIWDGAGKTHQFNLRTKYPVAAVELDPYRLSHDPNRLNNRIPAKWKVLLDRFSFNYDFQTQFVGFQSSFLFQRIYDTKNWIRLVFDRAESGESASLGFSHTLRRNHLLTIALSQLRTDADPQTNKEEEEATFATLGYAFVFPDVPLLSESIQRLTTHLPTLNIGLTYNQEFTSADYEQSSLLKLSYRKLYTYTNYHEIAGRVFVGQSIGKLFEDSRFYLGGTSGMRGYTPLAFEGQNIALTSAEYRFPLFYETDINFMGLAHTHTWQGAFFADAGMVSDDRNVFKVKDYKYDVGFGLRFFVDLFGVYPSILRTDFAWPIDSPKESEKEIHYYLNLGQAF